MNILQAALLGVVEGITEFLPISSDGHLFLVREILRWPDQGLAFDAVLHLGTLLAIVIGLWREWLGVLRGLASILKTRKIWSTPEQRLIVLLVLATLPGALAGFFFESIFAETFRSLLSVGLWFAATGAFYFFVEYSPRVLARTKSKALAKTIEAQPSAVGALWIGLAQAAALLPGVSRSGMTIATGTLLGLSRKNAAPFSFLMAGPITFGAIVKSFLEPSGSGSLTGNSWGPLFVGIVVAFVVGWFALKILLRYLKTHTLKAFGSYMLGVGGAVLLLKILGAW